MTDITDDTVTTIERELVDIAALAMVVSFRNPEVCPEPVDGRTDVDITASIIATKARRALALLNPEEYASVPCRAAAAALAAHRAGTATGLSADQLGALHAAEADAEAAEAEFAGDTGSPA